MLRFLLPPALAAAGAIAMAGSLHAQTAADRIEITIDTQRDTGAISPFIYGSNGQSDDRDENIAARRLGGNRITGYNWENNASNAGQDYLHQSDDYLTYRMPAARQHVPGIVPIDFHDSSLATGCYSLITLPAAGFVARDTKGPVDAAQTAPSSRWQPVRFAKGAPFTVTPDTSDGAVYVDEEVNALVQRYGRAGTERGIRGYAVDNEPGLWPSTHPRIHMQKPTIAEMITRTTDLAKAVKDVDPNVEIFGSVAYGYAEYMNFQDAPDWSSYSSYGTYLDAFLAKMQEASAQNGRRLVDVLDLHWYPEAQGTDRNGQKQRIPMNENHDPGVAWARMQAPRSLWDSSYTEDSWIGQYFSPVALLPFLRNVITRRNPGTKLAFTEINYGGDHDISGGIAMADVLGLFGKYDVYMSNYWGPIEGYVSTAYRIFRNYDGSRAAFGAHRAHAATSDPVRTSAYASTDSAGNVHIIAINRDTSAALEFHVVMTAAQPLARLRTYGFGAADTVIRAIGTAEPIAGNTFTVTVPKLSVYHFIAERSGASGVTSAAADAGMRLDPPSPNPAQGSLDVGYSLASAARVHIGLYDLLGREVRPLLDADRGAGEGRVHADITGLASGTYLVRLESAGSVRTERVVVVEK